jgi:ribosomal protein L37E
MKYDQTEGCAKCGYPGKTVEYNSELLHRGSNIIEIREDLRLTCSRCGYSWFRDCLDKEESNG